LNKNLLKNPKLAPSEKIILKNKNEVPLKSKNTSISNSKNEESKQRSLLQVVKLKETVNIPKGNYYYPLSENYKVRYTLVKPSYLFRQRTNLKKKTSFLNISEKIN
jgi:hypothetical protein